MDDPGHNLGHLTADPEPPGGSGCAEQERRPRLLLYYPHGFSIRTWSKAHQQAERPEASHWGMHQAEASGFAVSSTEDARPRWWQQPMRSLFFRLFRADLAHLWNNRRKFDADAVWAMSERELLLAVWLAWLTRRRSRPVLVGEVIWLIDDWPCFDPVRRWLWRVTLSAADCLLVATEGSARKLCDILPNANIRAYRFGIPLNVYTSLRDRPGLLEGAGRKRPVRVLAAGNDLRRDWETVAKALGGDERFDVTLLSRRTAVRDMAKFGANVHYQQADRLSGLLERYRWADMVVIASLPNSHGAGMTMLLEAAAAGIPIICASTGFIDEFFDEDSVTYVPPCDPAALKRAAAALAADPAEAAAKAKRARRAITRLGYGSMDAVDRRCAIIRQCLWNSSLAAIDRPTASSSTPAEPKATPR